MLGLYWDNGKENGNYYSVWGYLGDNGKENRNYCLGFRVLFGSVGRRQAHRASAVPVVQLWSWALRAWRSDL